MVRFIYWVVACYVVGYLFLELVTGGDWAAWPNIF